VVPVSALSPYYWLWLELAIFFPCLYLCIKQKILEIIPVVAVFGSFVVADIMMVGLFYQGYKARFKTLDYPALWIIDGLMLLCLYRHYFGRCLNGNRSGPTGKSMDENASGC
jgi:hypothetical protein